MGHKEGDILCN